MKLLLKRIALRPTYTIGRLFIDGEYFCDTLEDRVRDNNKDGDLEDQGEGKVRERTAIPYGTYKITMNVVSPKYKGVEWAQTLCGAKMPRLLDVKHFDGILIHPGNTEHDTAGCILIGENKAVGKVLNSRATFIRLYRNKLALAMARNEPIEISIE